MLRVIDTGTVPRPLQTECRRGRQRCQPVVKQHPDGKRHRRRVCSDSFGCRPRPVQGRSSCSTAPKQSRQRWQHRRTAHGNRRAEIRRPASQWRSSRGSPISTARWQARIALFHSCRCGREVFLSTNRWRLLRWPSLLIAVAAGVNRRHILSLTAAQHGRRHTSSG